MDPFEQAWDEAVALHTAAADTLDRGETALAAQRAADALAALSGLLGADHPDAANAAVTLGEALLRGGDLAGAAVHLEGAVAALGRHRRHPDVRPLWWNARKIRADLWRQEGRYGDAVAELGRVLRAVRGTAQELATTNLLGIARRFAGDYAGAKRAYLRALAWLNAHTPDDAATRAVLHHNLSGLAHARGDYSISEYHIRTALALRGDARDAAYGGDLGGLALALVELGRADEALAAFDEARAIYAQTLPPDHPEVAYLLHNLGDAWMAVARPQEALDAYDQSLALKRARLGADHPEVAVSLANSRLPLLALGRAEEAASRLIEARRIVQGLPEGHPFREGVLSVT